MSQLQKKGVKLVEVFNNFNELRASKGTEVKSRDIQSEDKDFRDFIKGNITMDELFKKREQNGTTNNNS